MGKERKGRRGERRRENGKGGKKGGTGREREGRRQPPPAQILGSAPVGYDTYLKDILRQNVC